MEGMRMKHLAAGFSLLWALAAAGCSSESVLLVNPRTGASVKCSASGAGIMAAMPPGMVQECLQKYEPQGYVTVEKLTPAERAEFERRGGSLPTEERRPY
jgi:hypothetical protein